VAAPDSRRNRSRRAQADAASTAARRSRLWFLAALAASAVVLAAWFPASALLTQRSDLSGTQSELASLHKQDAALAQEKKNLSDNAEIGRIARQQYQLVDPGQQAYEVLPPSGAAAAGTPYAGDPGSAAATPSATPELPPGNVTTTTTAAGRPAPGTAADQAPESGLLSRMLHTLEFWR
jgi:cell division protein FtsB